MFFYFYIIRTFTTYNVLVMYLYNKNSNYKLLVHFCIFKEFRKNALRNCVTSILFLHEVCVNSFYYHNYVKKEKKHYADIIYCIEDYYWLNIIFLLQTKIYNSMFDNFRILEKAWCNIFFFFYGKLIKYHLAKIVICRLSLSNEVTV